MTITIEGERLDSPAKLVHRGAVREMRVPKEALPDCNVCPKPDLHPANYDVLAAYNLVNGQQTFNPMNGARLGLRLEAVIPVIEWMERTGRIESADDVLERLLLLDGISNRIFNQKLSSKGKASNQP